MNKTYFKLLFYTALFFFLTGCAGRHNSNATPEDYFVNKKISSKIHAARLFDIYETDGIKKVVIRSPFSDTTATAFYLVPKRLYGLYKNQKNVLEYPLTRVAVLSATQLNAVDKLGLLNSVVGVSDVKYLSDTALLKKIKEGTITEVSAGGHLFTEKTILLHPEALFFSPYRQGQTPVLQGSVQVIPFFDFMEDSPLGRAEWIKFTAAFLGNEPVADALFSDIEHAYLRLKAVAEKTAEKPSVFSGKYFNGQWFVPGGKSYMAQLFNDAGAHYLWKDNLSRNSIPLDFEVVLQKAGQADFWRILGGLSPVKPYEKLEQENRLYSHFKAFTEHHIIYCNPAENSYFEKSVLEPQVVLKDFIFAFHPGLFPGYRPVYYEVLP